MQPRKSPHLRKTSPTPLDVKIAGGGVAALEAALALRALAADRVNLTLVAPTDDFVYRPVSVVEPFAKLPPRRLPLAKFAAELNATFEQDSVASVDAVRRTLLTGRQRELPYDALVIAVGARAHASVPNAIAMDPSHMEESLGPLIRDVDSDSIRTAAFVVPKPSWPLPVYEVALLLRERARANDAELTITVITTEQGPLAVFGETVSSEVAEALARADIETILGARVESAAGKLVVHPGGRELGFDRVVAVPQLRGPAIAGLPADADGFLPVTPTGEVADADSVYAAGDSTDFPVKFGGLAAQQADAVAASIAELAGAPAAPARFDGLIHGILQSGWKPSRQLCFAVRFKGGIAVESSTSDTPTSWPAAKVGAGYLGPYLDRLWAEAPRWLANEMAWETTFARVSGNG
jgi:sulfide:quinone oxidoreductase